jgi:hypothetical protein
VEIRGAIELHHKEGGVVKLNATCWAACSICAN